MQERPIAVLFHRDLRTDDHPALAAAAETGAPVVPIYIRDQNAEGGRAPGGASRWWLHHSLQALGKDLAELGAPLILRSGDTVEILRELCDRFNIGGIYMSRGYEPWVRQREADIHAAFQSDGINVKRYRGRLLIDPDQIRTKTGAVYKVYTPFWKALIQMPLAQPCARPTSLRPLDGDVAGDQLDDWNLLPTAPDWAAPFQAHWQPGGAAGRKRFDAFVESGLANYDSDRNRPDLPGTSRLSPHFHFGEVSPLACFHRGLAIRSAGGASAQGAETYLKELVWREFSYHLLYHFQDLPDAPFKANFANFPWREDAAALSAWQCGQTGYPLVDAGMRELWKTGWMHNRVRMVVGSFLTKNLLLPWQLGEAWFWDCLVDADLASNAASWQWVSGSGADAAPYFRIFNPVAQSERFDPAGHYIRLWVPELAKLDKRHIHAPWLASSENLTNAGVKLGINYPLPIVDHKATRQRALDAYAQIKSTTS